jgi:hypothetical protein
MKENVNITSSFTWRLLDVIYTIFISSKAIIFFLYSFKIILCKKKERKCEYCNNVYMETSRRDTAHVACRARTDTITHCLASQYAIVAFVYHEIHIIYIYIYIYIYIMKYINIVISKQPFAYKLYIYIYIY